MRTKMLLPTGILVSVLFGCASHQQAGTRRPDDTGSHITGKQFIPFFFGGDTHRLEAF